MLFLLAHQDLCCILKVSHLWFCYRVCFIRQEKYATSTGKYITRSTSVHRIQWSQHIHASQTIRKIDTFDTNSTTYCKKCKFIRIWPAAPICIQGAPIKKQSLGKSYLRNCNTFFTKFTVFTEENSGHVCSKFRYSILFDLLQLFELKSTFFLLTK